MQSVSVLHLDHDDNQRLQVREALSKKIRGLTFRVQGASSVPRSWEEVPDIILMDVQVMIASGGVSAVSALKAMFPHTAIAIFADVNDAFRAKPCLERRVADDFVARDCKASELATRLAHMYLVLREETEQTQYPEVVGSTMRKLIPTVRRVLDSAVSSLHVYGESGTGKELVSHLIQQMIAPRPMVRVNCGGITSSLLTSQMFGHRRGAFTGAVSDHQGFFERARDGWLFLDEISCLDFGVQSALLRVLENQEIIRVGESVPRKIAVNILSASNTPIPQLVEEGKFRGDLWQRLQEMVIEIPPLRERKEEITDFISHFARHMRGGPYRVTEEVAVILNSYSWEKGNVRELRNCLRRMTSFHQNKWLIPLSLPSFLLQKDKYTQDQPLEVVVLKNLSRGRYNINYDMLSHMLLLECVKVNFRNHGRSGIREFAASFGLSPSTLSRKLKSLIDYCLITPQELSLYIAIKLPREQKDKIEAERGSEKAAESRIKKTVKHRDVPRETFCG